MTFGLLVDKFLEHVIYEAHFVASHAFGALLGSTDVLGVDRTVSNITKHPRSTKGDGGTSGAAWCVLIVLFLVGFS